MTPHLTGQPQAGTLCAPFPGITCLHCCPPIRPRAHDTLSLRPSWGPLLRRNRESLQHNLAAPTPADGRSCWALGFLDREERAVGCLLHPARHGGRDLRHLVDLGGKCAREACQEARVFQDLQPEERMRCLACAPQGDSFVYSSRSQNLLFRLLAWEKDVVLAILCREEGNPLAAGRLMDGYAALFTVLQPPIDGYWVSRTVENGRWSFLDPKGLGAYKRFRDEMAESLRTRWGKRPPKGQAHLPMVHSLGIPLSLSRWLKFHVGIWRATPHEMTEICETINKDFNDSLGSFME